MDASDIWLWRFGQQWVVPVENVIALLGKEGVCAEAICKEDASGPGAVLFESVTQELCDSIRELSDGGFERVLGVAARGSDLSREDTWSLLDAGASDVFAWDQVLNPAGMVAARFKRWVSTDRLLASPVVRENLVGRSRAWLSVLRELVEVARWTGHSIMITGESGTGKELAARLIHELDARPNKGELILLDCTTVVPELSGSEFFGHERGAFTSAVAARDGAFALADGGTLFLDEVGELPLRLQAELLRVVQERTYKRVGGNTWKRTNFRLVCATNRNLEEEKGRGAFREDLYQRLASWTYRLPTLDERREDIPLLADHFLKLMHRDQEPPTFHPTVRDYLLARDYPGNVRELQHLVTRIASRHVGPGPITVGSIPDGDRPTNRLGDEPRAITILTPPLPGRLHQARDSTRFGNW